MTGVLVVAAVLIAVAGLASGVSMLGRWVPAMVPVVVETAAGGSGVGRLGRRAPSVVLVVVVVHSSS
ncbi:MAG TPA: hypothetical protein VLB67_06675 [Acidimicrobiia bacterium]|nr:hypothetical protein [Acidimicrobiia bacterium]